MNSISISKNTAIINGKQGEYGKEDIKDSKSRYGANAVSNYMQYVKSLAPSSIVPLDKDTLEKSAASEIETNANILADQLESDSMPPIKFNFKYSPAKLFKMFSPVHKMSLMAAANEELKAAGYNKAIPVEDMTAIMQEAHPDKNVSAQGFDINEDGLIDVSEEAATIVLTDMLSAKKYNVSNVKKANGKTNNLGEARLQEFALKGNEEHAKEVLSNIHTKLKLQEAQEKYFSINA